VTNRTADHPPDVVVVVLDCGRAAEFPEGISPSDQLPFLTSFADQCLRFRNSISPSSWTIPSHATLLTGLEPWEHGTHGKNSLRLYPAISRLPGRLHDSGYKTGLFSANHLLGSAHGLSLCFDRALTASSAASYFRQVRGPIEELDENGSLKIKRPRLRSYIEKSLLLPSRGFQRAPALLDVIAQADYFLRGKDAGPSGSCRWLEPAFGTWVSDIPKPTPLFALVNLMDLHEPYLTVRKRGDGLEEWWKLARTRQDTVGWAAGRWRPNNEEISRIKKLYLRALREVDDRVRAIVELLKTADRWEDTIFILTADHGQALGERGFLFHNLRVDESVIRIPLWVRFPRSQMRGLVKEGWVTLSDITQTIFGVAGIQQPVSTSPRPLGELASCPRTDPVCSVSDGLVWKKSLDFIPPSRRKALDHVIGAAYRDEIKACVDVSSGAINVYDIRSDPMETVDIFDQGQPVHRQLVEAARAVAMKISFAGETPSDARYAVRIDSWGYG